MSQRLEYQSASPEAFKAMLHLEQQIHHLGLEESLLERVKSRASQINGCAYCLDMHSKDARAEGETEQRLYCLPAWRETDFYTERERAALAWTEAVTSISTQHVSDELFQDARKHFSEDELAHLTLAVVAINGWNRFAIAFHKKAGTYEPPARKVREQVEA